MTYVFSQWDKIKKKLQRAKGYLILFDLDGTLAPIAKTPRHAQVSGEIKYLVRQLAARKNSIVGILSGRSLSNTKLKMSVPGLVWGGNHGLELEGKGFHFVHPKAFQQSGQMKKIYRLVQDIVGHIPGLCVENKGLSLGLHYRLVNKRNRVKFRSLFRARIQPFCQQNFFTVEPGKKMLEIKPQTAWNKGSAVHYLKKKLNFKGPVIFLGDDRTDEDAFRSLTRNDIGIHVGRSRASEASFYLRRQSDVPSFLRKMISL